MPTIEMIEIKKLNLLKNNPRSIKQDQMQKLCESMKDDPEFFSQRPVLVHKESDQLNVYAGNQRIRAAKKLGWKKVPCIVEENIPEDIIKQRIIKDNHHHGDWDYDLLAADYDIEMLLNLGFTTQQLHLDIDDVDSITSEEDSCEDSSRNCELCGQKIKEK